MVDRLDGLRHHAVVRRHDQDGQVGGLRTAGTHGGKRLVARGIQERDLARLVFEGDLGLVRADALGNAAGLAAAHVCLADRVQKTGLTVVDVAHDGDHWRALLQRFFAAFVLAELQVEGLEQLAVLVLGRDDLHLVVDLSAEQLQRVLGHGLRRRHHLTEVEQRLHERRRLSVDLLCQVRQGCALTQADGLAAAVGETNATDDVRLVHLLVFSPLLALGLTALAGCTTRTAECACGAAATTAATAETATRATETRTARSATTATTTAATATTARGGRLRRHLCRGRTCRHVCRGRTGAAALTCAAGARTALAGAATARTSATRTRRTLSATGVGRERVVGHTRTARLRHRTRHSARRRSAALGTRLGSRLRCARLRCGLRRTRLGGARLGCTRLRGTRLRGTRLRRGLRPTRLGCSRLGSARLRSARLRSGLATRGLCGARLRSTRGRLRLCARLRGGRLRRRCLRTVLARLLQRRLLRRSLSLLVVGSVVAACLLGVVRLHLLHDGRLDRRRRRLHKLALLLERGKQFLTCYAELFSQLMNA